MLTRGPLFSIPTFHALGSGETLLLDVPDAQYIIGVEKVPWHTIANLTQKGFLHKK